MNRWLLCAGIASLVVAALHVAIVAGGPSWYRAYGAGEAMARLAERGSPLAAVITLALAGAFVVCALYAFSGTGAIRPLPFLVPGLAFIAVVYLFRGALLVPTLFGITPLRNLPTIKPHDAFTWWSSLVAFGIGVLYATGALQFVQMARR